MIGIIPQQIDYEDYRAVENVKLPFTIRLSSVDASSPIITRKVETIKLNAPVDETKFNQPTAAKPPGR